MPRLQIITASTRPGRVGSTVAAWALDEARRHGAFDVEAIDLAEVALPFLDEPQEASTGHYVHQHTKDWSATISRGDACLFVMPMYNGTYSAPLKNAIDFLYDEWQDKPVGLFTYTAGPSGGLPAIEALRPILTRIGFRPAERSVRVPGIGELTGPDGFRAPAGLDGELAGVLDELAKLAADADASPAQV
ncbi:NADPH-dependent FMN reductase [Streptomyces roseus]|uniref:NADPH-dependent FMN reductase n=1 Tax=Streptomyces roseus TaxID=66430 RepID=A0A0J6XUH3_9ACTN|nr:NAD(P)H-dependent oxidoreductase [Streptomyces roseus]KMO99800.1 NADPH-dependent FMN reductase [Streptomyces roseus]